MGRFLKDFGKLDKTKAGKIMIASGKAMSYSSQQRLALRPSIMRLAEEVDTFRYSRCISVGLRHIFSRRLQCGGAKKA